MGPGRSLIIMPGIHVCVSVNGEYWFFVWIPEMYNKRLFTINAAFPLNDTGTVWQEIRMNIIR